MVGYSGRSWRKLGLLVALLWLSLALLSACGQEATATPDYSRPLTPVEEVRPTVTPPFQPATNITPEVSQSGPTASRATTGAATAANTPVLKPTPVTPAEEAITSDELGIGSWSDTGILWSPAGDIFLLQVLREGSDGDFYYLIRPPDSVQSSFKLPRAVFGTMSWSPDGRYLSYIERESEGSGGPVKVIDVQRDVTRERRAFNGPCTGVAWLSSGKLVATCGLAVYLLSSELETGARTELPEVLFKLENNRFPGSNVELSLIFNALPSPDGTTMAMFGLRKQGGPLPIGEIGFYNLGTKKLDLLDRNNRPVTLVGWTPDSKYMVLRNITGDYSVSYTFDFYLADPAKLKITQNLTRSNDKCDPVLGAKPECQGANPSTIQSQRVLFSPDGERYFFSGFRYVARPNAPLAAAERLSISRLNGGRTEQLVETAPGERIVGLTWLPNGHYFYSVGLGNQLARAVLDGKPLEIARSQRGATSPRGTPLPTKSGALSGYELPAQAQPTTVAAPAPTTAAAPAPASPVPPSSTPAPPPAATTPELPAPTVTLTPAPRGTSLLFFDTATAQARATPTQAPIIAPVPRAPEPTPTPQPVYPRAVAYHISPVGNWLLAIERIASADKVVQFQVRLIPFFLK